MKYKIFSLTVFMVAIATLIVVTVLGFSSNPVVKTFVNTALLIAYCVQISRRSTLGIICSFAVMGIIIYLCNYYPGWHNWLIGIGLVSGALLAYWFPDEKDDDDKTKKPNLASRLSRYKTALLKSLAERNKPLPIPART